MNTMKAVVCNQYGPPDVLQVKQVAIPRPGNNEVLVRIKATAVNSGDVRVRGLVVPGFLRIVMRFVLGFNKPRKPILGTVLSGVVEVVGNKVQSFKAGDEVYAMTGMKFGTYAEYITLKEKGVIAPKPVNASFEEAAAIIFGGSTAIYFLNKAKIQQSPQKKVLIYGATGSVGTSAIQIAQYHNAEITAVCSEEGSDLVKSLGAGHVIIYTREDFTKTGAKFDIIFDAVGKLKKKDCSALLSGQGKFVTVGGLDVASETKDQLLFLKNLFEKDQLKAVIDKAYDLDNMVEAHRYVDTGRKKGNVVIKV